MIGRRAAIAALVALAIAGVAARPARAGWSQPSQLAGPSAVDVLPAEISFSASGDAAIAYSLQDVGQPAVSSSYVVVRPRHAAPGAPRPVPGALETLDVGFPGPLALLTGASPAGESCCTEAQVVLAQRGGLGAPRTLLSGLTGVTIGRLVPLDGRRALAAFATGRGVWVTQSGSTGQFPPARRLTAAADGPLTLAAASLAGDRTIVAWAAQPSTRTIFVSTGSRLRGPRARRAAIVVPNGHQVDELAVVRGRSQPTVAWIESWFDSRGGYHSQPVAEDLAPSGRAHSFPVGADSASGLTLAADTRGDQVMSWEQCNSAGACSVMAASRPAGGRFGVAQQLGAIDPSQSPVATISPAGQELVGWIRLGQVLVASRPPAPAGSPPAGSAAAPAGSPPAGSAAAPAASPPAGSAAAPAGTSPARSPSAPARFGAARVISHTSLASDLALAFGPAGEALAAWTQGTIAPTVDAAVYRAGR